ncbi:MAG: putative transposase [Candidatus Azotimanducaceae bacterium]|jgi:putative transposase
MTTRNINLIPGEYYHVYNRGNSKQIIYKDSQDYRRFTELLYLSNSVDSIRVRDHDKIDIFDKEVKQKHVHIGAYCLIPNHFHILLTPTTEEGATKFMLKLSTAYVMYFNQRYERTGALFEGTYKSEYVDSDRYLKYLFSYIHLNPVKLFQHDWKEVGIKNINKTWQSLENYAYSSFQEYTDTPRPSEKILSVEAFPSYFPKPKLFTEELLDWITLKDR